MHGEKRNLRVYRVLVGKPEVERPLIGPRHGWGNNIQIDFKEIWWGSMDWLDLSQDRVLWRALVNTVLNFRVP
jgi:hypothetical protein